MFEIYGFWSLNVAHLRNAIKEIPVVVHRSAYVTSFLVLALHVSAFIRWNVTVHLNAKQHKWTSIEVVLPMNMYVYADIWSYIQLA